PVTPTSRNARVTTGMLAQTRLTRVPDVDQAAFVAEARALADLPAAVGPEIAIAGRSNVGKSTLLNRLAGRKGLARTSKTPGRTPGLGVFAPHFRKGGRTEPPPGDPLAPTGTPRRRRGQVSPAERRACEARAQR